MVARIPTHFHVISPLVDHWCGALCRLRKKIAPGARCIVLLRRVKSRPKTKYFVSKLKKMSFSFSRGILLARRVLCCVCCLFWWFPWRLVLLLLVELLVEALAARSHDSVLATHSPVESTLKLCAEGELAHGVCLLVCEDDALGRKGLVLHAVETGSDVANLGVGRVGGSDGGSQ
jgi:hypothetical protein